MSAVKDIESFGEKAKVVPGIIRLGLLGLSALGFAYSWYYFSGPYLWLAELQASIFDGEYYLLLTALLSFLIFLLPAVLIVRLLVPYYTKKKNPSGNDDIVDEELKEDHSNQDIL
ncbi:MAG: hypothetical protein MK078_08005 [Crocinitomicaceae bacterium]|nr:hypothetical protein [Crocinitomicaceae bacterium]